MKFQGRTMKRFQISVLSGRNLGSFSRRITLQPKRGARGWSNQGSTLRRASSIRYGLFGSALGIFATTILITQFHIRGIDLPAGSGLVTKNSSISLTSRYADVPTQLEALKEIEEMLGSDSISLDKDVIDLHGYSEWSTSNTCVRPVAVITPTSTEAVSSIARICNKHRIPIVPFGAGSSVEGNFSAPFSGFSIDLSRMDKIIAFHEDDMDVVVQPGVNWVDLNEEIKASGLFLPLDPSPTAHIGGMVATNCSGTNAMRYGTMKDWVINVTVVLANGDVIKTRRRPRKTSAGYNLTALFTGSEGTLGIITEITLKLAVVPALTTVATVSFPSVRDAAAAASRMMRQGISLNALELMDDVQMKVINQTRATGNRVWKELPTLFLKFGGTEQTIQESVAMVKTTARAFKGEGFTVATNDDEKESIWSARKLALWSMLAIRPEGTQIWSTDVAVPLSRMAEIIESSKRNSAKLGLFSSVLGHVGDGNFHQAVMYDPNNFEQKQGVRECVDGMMMEALEMEGTVSGEHGIGLGKKHCLANELGPDTIAVMRALKTSLDPNWILNPGKIFDA